jgi:hypothetical protein
LRLTASTAFIALLLVAAPMQAQTPVEPVQPEADPVAGNPAEAALPPDAGRSEIDPADSEPADIEPGSGEILVVGTLQRGAVLGEIQPTLQLDAEAVQALGASSLSDILAELGPQLRSGRGRGGGDSDRGLGSGKGLGKDARGAARRPRAGGPLAFAGLAEDWLGADGSEIDTMAIVTVPANADATIQAIKMYDSAAPASTGKTRGGVILLPGASGNTIAAKRSGIPLISRS